MDTLWQNSIVLIRSSDLSEQSFGTGFVIYKDAQATYILTCTHVVREVGGPEELQINGIQAKVIVSSPEENADLAILCIDGLFAPPPLPLCAVSEKGESLSTAGFQLTVKQIMIRELYGTLGKQVGIEMKGQVGRIKAWDLEITGKDLLQSGYSGAPVVDEHDCVIGVVSTLQGEGKRGVAISIEEIEKIWSDMPLLFRGQTLNKFQRFEEAVASFEEALNLDSSPRDALIGKAEALAALQRPEEALAIYVQAMTLDPNDLEACINQGLLLAELKRYKEAITVRTQLSQLSLSDAQADQRRIQGMLAIEANIPLGTTLTTLSGHPYEVHAIAWSPDGRYLASAGADGFVWLWDGPSGKLLTSLKRQKSQDRSVNALAWSPDGQLLATAGNGSEIPKALLWDASSGTVVSTLGFFLQDVQGLAWSPDGQSLAVAEGAARGQVKVWWDINSGKFPDILQR